MYHCGKKAVHHYSHCSTDKMEKVPEMEKLGFQFNISLGKAFKITPFIGEKRGFVSVGLAAFLCGSCSLAHFTTHLELPLWTFLQNCIVAAYNRRKPWCVVGLDRRRHPNSIPFLIFYPKCHNSPQTHTEINHWFLKTQSQDLLL